MHKKKWRYIYVLECEAGHYYVGQTTNVQRRFQKHKYGNGSWFTQRYRPIRIKEVVPITFRLNTSACCEFENQVTSRYIHKYGLEYVRGGAFIQRDIKHFYHLLNRYSPNQ